MPKKPVVCYHCALRMSTLFCVPPPTSRTTVLAAAAASENSSEPTVGSPILRSDMNRVFDIVYETEASAQRILSGPSAHSSDAAVPFFFTTAMLSATQPFELPDYSCRLAEARSSEHVASSVRHLLPICVACCGLYQFLDEVIAPLIAASVRVSPFLDSTEVSTNVNCPRSMAFVWLAAAVDYRTGVPGDRADGGSLPPSPSAVVPEEFGNFKDFYMGDMRARVLRFLTMPCSDDTDVFAPADVPGARLYADALRTVVRRRRERQGVAVPWPPSKRPREDDHGHGPAADDGGDGAATRHRVFEDHHVPRLCNQAFQFVAQGSGVVIEIDALAPQAYDDLALPEKYSGMTPKGAQEAVVTVVPSQYCSNKGVIMTYSVIYDYVLPHFQANRLGRYGLVALPMADQATNNTGSEAAVGPSMLTVCGLRCVISHQNTLLIGLYRKMLRSLSQSPWFSNGGRIGSYSLQEVIAEPFLRVAFPYGIPCSLLPSNVARRQERTLDHLGTLSAEEFALWQSKVGAGGSGAGNNPQQRRCPGRLTTGMASPWQDVDPFQASLDNVVGYGRYKFHSAGREDVDVRMLGTGRPFVLELIAPHCQTIPPARLRQLESVVNEGEGNGGGVEIERMQYTTSDITVDLARHSESKTKTYRCVVWCGRIIASDADPIVHRVNAMRDVVVVQKTPLRVLHRRSLLDRPKIIHRIQCTRLNDHWLMVDLETQAGTYVKEFVHGDNGRTTPSLGELLEGRTDIIQLDVLGMTMPDIMKAVDPGAVA